MRFLILCSENIRHMSMITIYIKLFKKLGVSFDLLYMDKYGEIEESPADRTYRFENIVSPHWGKLRKVIKYWRFKPYATRIIKENNYDFIVVWKETTAFVFSHYLARHWKGKYCLNIRDDNHFKNPLVRAWYEPAFRNAAFRTISSDIYRSFLPDYDYIHVHSMNEELLSSLKPKQEPCSSNKPINIGFIGNVRFFDINRKMLDVFKNDSRFVMHYYGTNASILKKYAEEEGILNAVFGDSFQVSETGQFLEKIDIMNNLYGNNSQNLITALSIKLYHSVYMRIPILVSSGTYMEEITTGMGIGYAVQTIDSQLPDALFDWYCKLDRAEINKSCTEFIEKIQKDNENFNNTVCALVEEIKSRGTRN